MFKNDLAFHAFLNLAVFNFFRYGTSKQAFCFASHYAMMLRTVVT